MADHRAHIHWQHDGGAFIKRQYSRAHQWTFDGGATVAASASPSGVPLPYADPAGDGFEVRRYKDAAVGRMTPNEQGVPRVSAVELSPRVIYDDGAAPTPEQEADLHHRAHAGCYIANSDRSDSCYRSRMAWRVAD